MNKLECHKKVPVKALIKKKLHRKGGVRMVEGQKKLIIIKSNLKFIVNFILNIFLSRINLNEILIKNMIN